MKSISCFALVKIPYRSLTVPIENISRKRKVGCSNPSSDRSKS